MVACVLQNLHKKCSKRKRLSRNIPYLIGHISSLIYVSVASKLSDWHGWYEASWLREFLRWKQTWLGVAERCILSFAYPRLVWISHSLGNDHVWSVFTGRKMYDNKDVATIFNGKYTQTLRDLIERS